MASITYYFFVIIAVFLCSTEIKSTSDDRIVGGRPAVDGEFPYQVSFRRSYNDNHFCGGSIIGPRHILTAAHCMFYIWGGVLPAMVVSIAAGQIELALDGTSITRNATKLHIHEDFNNKAKSNDIAIVELDRPLPFDTQRVAIAALRSTTPKAGIKCTVSGWGVQEFESQVISDSLLAAEVNVIDFEKCIGLYAEADIALSPGMMCAGLTDGSKDACQGDSGGPLFCNGLLTGVVSTALGCADARYPGIYTDIAQYLPWINNIMYQTKRW